MHRLYIAKDQKNNTSKFDSYSLQLKKELRSEIVRDVTRKTVREVLKGLDGAVIESLQGTSLIANTTTEVTKGKSPKGEHGKFQTLTLISVNF